MPWWKHLYCVLGKCTECGNSAGQCLTWLIWNGLCVSGDLAEAQSAVRHSVFSSFFHILCLVQSVLFKGKVLVIKVPLLDSIVSWSCRPIAWWERSQFYYFPEKMHCSQARLITDFSNRRKNPWPVSPVYVPALCFFTAGNLHTQSCQVEVTLGNWSVQNRAGSKEKLFGQHELA